MRKSIFIGAMLLAMGASFSTTPAANAAPAVAPAVDVAPSATKPLLEQVRDHRRGRHWGHRGGGRRHFGGHRGRHYYGGHRHRRYYGHRRHRHFYGFFPFGCPDGYYWWHHRRYCY
ncbi:MULTISPECIES: hypothetical protein [Rhodomicrobium]|uniref:hypothetical protein n=1 Tax=Rhodomicrobium TaxID=1068 RepID=UPI000B4C1DC9|nr:MULTISPECIES: hypothetical protein [Rhodomicrobium]